MGAIRPGGGGGSASLPTTPALALLDAGNPDTVVVINGDGEGRSLPPSDVVLVGIEEDPAAARAAMEAAAIPTAGLDAARPAAAVAILGALYSATDTGVRYLCESDGAGGARWVVSGARGQEGRDTTAVRCVAGTTYAATSASLAASTVASLAIVFAPRTAPSALGMLMSVKTGSTGWQIEIGRDSGDRSLISVARFGLSGSPATLGVTISAAPTAMHCLAITFDGTNVRASLDGGAVVVTSLGTGSLTDATQPWRINAQETSSYITDIDHTSAVIWSTAVGDSDLVAVSNAAKAAGSAPGRIPAVSGATEIARWHAGWQRAPLLTEPLLKGTLAGSVTWSAAPTLVIR